MVKMKKGFTLIELLVVMTILAILATVGISMYESAQVQTRDTKRRGDIDAISAALEQRYKPSQYPALSGDMFQGGSIPQDPTTNTDYDGVAAVKNDPVNLYVICAALEGKNGNSSDNSGTKATGEAATFYCRQNLQGG